MGKEGLEQLSQERTIYDSPLCQITYLSADTSILFSNERVWKFFECEDETDFMQFCNGRFLNLIAKKDHDQVESEYYLAYDNIIETQHQITYRVETKSGKIITVEDIGELRYLEDGTQVVSCVLIQKENSVASIDGDVDRLTGVLTRDAFLKYADEVLHRADENGTYNQYFLIYTNIRNFKYYNLKRGATAGNRILKEYTEMLKTGSSDQLNGRYNGDHFVTLSNHTELFDFIAKANDYFESEFGKFGIMLKIGVYRINDKGISGGRACDLAKIACDSIRNENSYIKFFDADMEKQLNIEAFAIQMIDKAILEKNIQIFYQPITRALTKKLCGLEALARWNDPEKGMIFPVDFIPALEKNQLITKLDLYVLEEVCKTIRQKQDLGYINVPVSINLSRLDFFSCDIVEKVENAVLKNGISRDMLNIEITESMVMDNHLFFEQQIQKLRNLGYSVWMDDFGSGYSSLNVLREYDLDLIKLDINFLRSMNEKSKQVIRSVISMAKEMHIQTLAEGVETEEQYEFLKNIGCEKIQGYLFGKPMSSDDLKAAYHGKEDKIELRRWKKYYETIGTINFMTDRPLAIVDYDGAAYHYLYVNETYRNAWEAIGISEPNMAEEIVNSKSSTYFHKYRSLKDSMKIDGTYKETDIYYAGHYGRLRTQLIAKEGKHLLFRDELLHFIRRKDDSLSFAEQGISDLYTIYDTILSFDMEKQSVNALVSGTNFEKLIQNNIQHQNEIAKIEEVADYLISYEDRSAFIQFFAYDTVIDRLKEAENNVLTGLFRTITDNGAYIWALHTLQLIPGHNKIVYAYQYTPSIIEQVRAENIGSSFESEDNFVWNALMESKNLNLFWKDANRRFLGANGRFLESYGISDVSEIIGKTDEDMKWHIDDEPFKDDELDVIQKGETTRNKVGKCIIKGNVRTIAASKEPIYKDGEIVGLLGAFTTVDELSTNIKEFITSSDIDQVTGLMSSQGVAKTCNDYIESLEFHHQQFAIITVIFEAYKRSINTYGVDVTKLFLKELGKVLSAAGNNALSVGRVSEGCFVCFKKYTAKEEIEQTIHDIRATVSKIHSIAGYDVTLDPLIKVFYSEDTDDIHNMINVASNGYHLDYLIQKQQAERNSSEILSRIPAAVVVFSISETSGIKRIYLSDQARQYTHIPESGNAELSDIVSDVYEEDRIHVYQEVYVCVEQKKQKEIDFRREDSEGKIYWNRLTLVPYKQKDGSYLLYGLYSDITELKKRAEQMEILSRTDGLTGLRNRNAMNEDFMNLSGDDISVIMMDIDEFKRFNDRFGHDVGDQVICMCAFEIMNAFPNSYCYRYGGDEFLVVALGEDQKNLEIRLQDMIYAVRSHRLGEKIPEVNVSYGVLNGSIHSKEDVHQLLKKADNLLYEQKGTK